MGAMHVRAHKHLAEIYTPRRKHPTLRQRISEGEKRRKENTVFDNAMEEVKSVHRRDVRFAGKKIRVEVEPSGGPPHPYGLDFGRNKDIIGASARRLHNSDISKMTTCLHVGTWTNALGP